jgi:hypothetical protein
MEHEGFPACSSLHTIPRSGQYANRGIVKLLAPRGNNLTIPEVHMQARSISTMLAHYYQLVARPCL